MATQRLKTLASQILNRLPAVKGRGEEATKQALILPMLDALGYDIWNPAEVCPEYNADFAIKKLGQKEKVDLAVLLEDVPRIYIEVKAVDVALNGHEGQLARYFNATPSVSLAILTNGIEYRFFTDTGDPNIMDQTPFHLVRLDAETDHGLEILARFHRSVFSPGSIRNFATELNYTAKISKFLRTELDLGERNPSESFVRWALAGEGSYNGRVTAMVVERFQPIIKDALQIVLRDIVRRSIAALDKEVISPSVSDQTDQPPSEPMPISQDEELSESSDSSNEVRPARVATENEILLFDRVKAIFESSEFAKAEIYDTQSRKNVMVEILYKSTSSYFAIYLNKPSFWIIRAAVDSKNPWIGFNINRELGIQLTPPGFERLFETSIAEFRLAVKSIRDINFLTPIVLAAFQQTIDEKKKV